MTDFQKIKIQELYKQGKGPSEISSIMNIDIEEIKTFLKRYKDADIGKPKCLYCGQELQNEYEILNKKFCSLKCKNAWWTKNSDKCNRTFIEHTCKFCGKKFSTRKKTSMFCSRKCYADARKKVK